MRTDKLHNIIVRVAPYIAHWLLRIWFATCRVREYGSVYRKKVDASGKAAIAIFWHYSLFYVFYHLRKDSAAVLVSASKDGDFVAQFAHLLNFSTIRGSRNKRGMRALKELLTCVHQGRNIGIVADGSQGPAQIVQPGAIMLASRTGSPILPMLWSASDYIHFRSWDRIAVPKPFSNVDFYYGEPIWIPPGLKAPTLETYRLMLEKSLNTLYYQAWSRYGKKRH